jgi:xanthine/CO dehydrogenase XdhC/CoxF family maturation factor
MDRREIERFLDAVGEARVSGQRAAVATIVRVRGSAYRREGTHMLIRTNGTYECALSGGCLEPSVAEAAVRVIQTGEPVVVNYDLADDSLWGLGMGCSGAIDVRIERLDELDRDDVMREWFNVLARGDKAALVTPLSGGSGRVLVRAGGESLGHLGDPAMEREAIARARTRLRDPFPHSGPERTESGELFYEIIGPAPELVVFGANSDVAPLARQAWTLGFAVTMVDVRSAYLTSEAFPMAKLVPAHFSQFATAVPLTAVSSVLVMNHHLERDEESLRYALESAAGYIGVLGPRSRYELLLSGLASRGYVPSASRLASVHSPVGLAIGAETPEEVAVSILAEILAVHRGFTGGFLTGVEGSLHRPDDKRLLTSS